jgi:hypothetical protein
VLAAALSIAAAAPLHADEWTLIDVTTRIANDARVTVVETHHIVLETTGRNTFRTFGLGADQAIRLTAITRIGSDGEPHPLKAVETVAGPDEYRYYDRGHVYFSIPPLGERVTVQYRFEYELVGAVAPAWAIAAGPGSRASDEQEFFWPWERVGHVVADWRRAWPALRTRYRFDHDVLLPSREGPGYTFRQIDYRLEYDTAWRDIAPTEDVGAATHGAYRTHKVFDYLGPGLPAQATTAPAFMRLASLAALPIAGTFGFLLMVAAARLRRGPPIDRTFVDTRILTLAPEEIAYWFEGKGPVVADVLARLAGEAAISIQADPPAGHSFEEADEDAPVSLRMRRVAADAGLTAFERDILDDLFGDAREWTTESHRQRHAGQDYDPDAAVERRLKDAGQGKGGATPGAAKAGSAKAGGTRWSPARVGLMLVFVFGLANVFRHAGPLIDAMPILGIWAFFMLTVVNGWPAGWWYPGRPVRGLLVPLVVLFLMQVAVLLIPNRPLPAEGWAASAIAVLAGYFLILVRSRISGGRGGVVADLLQMRAYADAELRRARPQLDDRWIPRLRGLGLGPAIDAWRVRHSAAGMSSPELGDRPLITTAYFSGMSPPPWVGPEGWADALTVYADDEDEDEDEDEDGEDDGEADGDEDAAADAGTGRGKDRT